jgi:hypothetical protein
VEIYRHVEEPAVSVSSVYDLSDDGLSWFLNNGNVKLAASRLHVACYILFAAREILQYNSEYSPKISIYKYKSSTG